VKRSPREEGLAIVGLLFAAMWVLEIVDQVIVDHKLDEYGIEPRETDGLIGIVAAPFLHADFGHLISNTVPFIIMGVLIALGGAVRVLAVTAIVGLVSGFGVWLIAPENTNHIGASGIVFGYGTYLMTRGFYNRSAVEILVGIVVAALFGTSLLAGLAPQQGISWQGHLFGAIGGVVAARLLMTDRERDRTQRQALPT
jgi:membrane associated rhomboid family serine protease